MVFFVLEVFCHHGSQLFRRYELPVVPDAQTEILGLERNPVEECLAIHVFG